MKTPTLITPTVTLQREFMEMVTEFRAAGETRFDAELGPDRDDFSSCLTFLQEAAV